MYRDLIEEKFEAIYNKEIMDPFVRKLLHKDDEYEPGEDEEFSITFIEPKEGLGEDVPVDGIPYGTTYVDEYGNEIRRERATPISEVIMKGYSDKFLETGETPIRLHIDAKHVMLDLFAVGQLSQFQMPATKKRDRLPLSLFVCQDEDTIERWMTDIPTIGSLIDCKTDRMRRKMLDDLQGNIVKCESNCEGSLSYDKEKDIYVIKFTDPENEHDTTITYNANEKDKLLVKRKGRLFNTLFLEKGKRNVTFYKLVYSSYEVATYTKSVDVKVTNRGCNEAGVWDISMTIDLRYLLEIRGADLQNDEMHIDINTIPITFNKDDDE